MTHVAVWDNGLGAFLGVVDIMPRLLPPPNKMARCYLAPRANTVAVLGDSQEPVSMHNVHAMIVNTGGTWVCECDGLSPALNAGIWFHHHTYEKRGRQDCLDDFAYALMLALDSKV